MSDRELLELAAKAADIRHIVYDNDYDGSFGLQCCDAIGRHTHSWNPINDDGDALRLLVDVGLELILWDEQAGVEAFCPARWPHKALAAIPYSEFKGDRRKTTRAAIVRAAAAMAKGVEL